MKTLREMLLERHHAMQPKLDALRQETIERLSKAAPETQARKNVLVAGWRTWVALIRSIGPMRTNLACLASAWLLIGFLNFDRPPASVEASVVRRVPSPRQALASLQEHRRQLLEWIEPTAGASAAAPRRRSELEAVNLMA